MKRQVTPYSDILHPCQVSQQTNDLRDTDLCYNVSVQSIWILKSKYKGKKTQPAAQQRSLVWSKAQGLGLIRSTLLLPCQQHEGRYRLSRSCILKDWSNLHCYLVHVNSETIPEVPAAVSRAGLPRSPGPLAALSKASRNSQRLQILQKYSVMLPGLGPPAMPLSFHRVFPPVFTTLQ